MTCAVPTVVFEALQWLGVPWERIEPLGGDVSHRRFFRVWVGGDTAVVCLYPSAFDPAEGALARWERLRRDDPEVRLTFASDPVAFLETSQWLAGLGIPVPRVRGVAGHLGCMLLEDVGDLSLELALPRMAPSQVLATYSTALGYLVTLQAHTPPEPSALVGTRLRLDAEKLSQELGFFHRACARFLGQVLPGWVPTWLTRLAEEASPTRVVLCHRDYHARNLYLKGETLYVLDHQDMRLGDPLYDVASLLWDPYVDLPESLRDTLLARLGVSVHPHLVAVIWQRLLKALGTYLNVLESRSGAVDTFTQAALRALASLRALGQPPGLGEVAVEGLLSRLDQGIRALRR